MTHRIYIEAVKYTNNGSTYEISFPVNPLTVQRKKGVKRPLTDGARLMLAHGQTGKVELWDRERSYPRMSGDVEDLAKITVSENEHHGPVFKRYRPFPPQR